MEKRYDAVVARKRAKQEELRRTARDKSKVDGMKVIVEEMLRDREHRIEQSMARFSDPHLRPDARSAKDGFLPVIGGPKNLSIAYTPVTNSEYGAFVKATGRKAPKGWKDGGCPSGKGQPSGRERLVWECRRLLQVADREGRQTGDVSAADGRGVGDCSRPHAQGCRLQLRREQRDDARHAVREDAGRLRRRGHVGQCLGMDEHRDDGADGRGEGKEGSGREGRLLELEAHQLLHGGA